MANKRKTKKRTIPGSIAFGVSAEMVICVVLCGVVAALVCGGSVKGENGKLLAAIVLLLSSGTGCIVASKLAGEQIAIVSAATGGVYALILLGVTLFFFDGHFSGLLIKILSILVGCIAACVMCAKRRKKHVSR